MANIKVSLVRRCKTPSGWRFLPVALSAKGRLKSNTVVVDGKEVIYPDGYYALRHYRGKKLVWTSIEGGASEALAALNLARKRSSAKVAAADAGIQVISDPARASIKDTISKFFLAASERGSNEASEVYERTMDSFVQSCRKTYVDELAHSDVSKWLGSMRKEGYADRTIANRYANFRSFLGFAGFNREQVKTLAGPKPRYEKGLPEIYSSAQLKAFFDALEDQYDRLMFRVLLEAGLREQEVQYLTYDRIDQEGLSIIIAANPTFGFKVKDGEARRVPISKELSDALISWRDSRPGTRVVFGRTGGKKDEPDGHLLRRLKKLVRSAGLNCNHCEGCLKERRDCGVWYLHRFRATCLTRLLQSGVDVRSVMQFAGHSDLESTLRYVRPMEHEEVQGRVATVKWY